MGRIQMHKQTFCLAEERKQKRMINRRPSMDQILQTYIIMPSSNYKEQGYNSDDNSDDEKREEWYRIW